MRKITIKKLIGALTLAAVVASVAVPASAVQAKTKESAAYEITADLSKQNVPVYGQVKAIEGSKITLENSNDKDPYQKIILNVVDDYTKVVDAVEGLPAKFADIKQGDTIYAYADTVMTRSMPPIANAQMVICAIPADFSVPTLVEVSQVTKNADGSILAATDRDVNLTFTKDTKLSPYLTKNIVTMDDIRPGTRMLAWYDVVALSFPGQATPSKAVLMAYDYQGYAQLSVGKASVNGTAVKFTSAEKPYVKSKKLMVPVKKLSEKLGYTVTVAKSGKLTVKSGKEVIYAITPGKKSITGKDYSLRTNAVKKKNVLFITAEDFVLLSNAKFVK